MSETTNTYTSTAAQTERPIKCVQYVIAQILDGVTFDALRDRIDFKNDDLDRYWHATLGAQIVLDRIGPPTVRAQLNALQAFIDELLDKAIDEVLTDVNQS